MNNVLLKIIDLKKYFPGKDAPVKALDGVSIDLHKGEILGLLGVNGAGKTTMSSILATLHPATEGQVVYQDKSIYDQIKAYRKVVGFCPQDINLIDDLTVEQNLQMAGECFGMSVRDAAKRADELIEKYMLHDYRDKSPRVLSGGYQRRVLIARSLMHSPELLILDEPTVGLDADIRKRLWDLIRQLRDSGVTVILTTHYLDEAEALSDRICILDKGKSEALPA